MPSPFRQLHPTLKRCKCGFTGTRTKFYTHIATQPKKDFFLYHGEIPHYTDVELPEQDYSSALAKADKQAKLIESI